MSESMSKTSAKVNAPESVSDQSSTTQIDEAPKTLESNPGYKVGNESDTAEVPKEPVVSKSPAVISAENDWGEPTTLTDHSTRHASDFGITSEEEYAKQAHAFFLNRTAYDTKTDKKGTIRVYDASTNSFGSYNSNGTTKTFYKPTDGLVYWQKQPGV